MLQAIRSSDVGVIILREAFAQAFAQPFILAKIEENVSKIFWIGGKSLVEWGARRLERAGSGTPMIANGLRTCSEGLRVRKFINSRKIGRDKSRPYRECGKLFLYKP